MPRKTATKTETPAKPNTAEVKKPVRARSSAATHKAPAKKAKAATASASASPAPFNPEAHREEILHQAYLYSLERGSSPSDPIEDWFRAENEIRRRFSNGHAV